DDEAFGAAWAGGGRAAVAAALARRPRADRRAAADDRRGISRRRRHRRGGPAGGGRAARTLRGHGHRGEPRRRQRAHRCGARQERTGRRQHAAVHARVSDGDLPPHLQDAAVRPAAGLRSGGHHGEGRVRAVGRSGRARHRAHPGGLHGLVQGESRQRNLRRARGWRPALRRRAVHAPGRHPAAHDSVQGRGAFGGRRAGRPHRRSRHAAARGGPACERRQAAHAGHHHGATHPLHARRPDDARVGLRRGVPGLVRPAGTCPYAARGGGPRQCRDQRGDPLAFRFGRHGQHRRRGRRPHARELRRPVPRHLGALPRRREVDGVQRGRV
ncbi:MAG: BUG/TctC family periplasmic protein, partial [uncultured Ramlibacter sp.]